MSDFPSDVIEKSQYDELVSEGGTEFLEEMIELFEMHIPPIISDLEKASEDEDRAQIRELAHSIKGSSSNIGAKQVTESARDVELAADSASLEDLKKMISQIRPLYESALSTLKSLAS